MPAPPATTTALSRLLAGFAGMSSMLRPHADSFEILSRLLAGCASKNVYAIAQPCLQHHDSGNLFWSGVCHTACG